MTHIATKRYIVALSVAAAVGLWLRFLLEPTGWLFYELYHCTGIDWMYRGYTLFRGGGYFFGGYAYRTPVCVAVGAALFIAIIRCSRRKRGDGI